MLVVPGSPIATHPMRPGEPPTAAAGGLLSGDVAARVSARAVAGVPWDGGAWAALRDRWSGHAAGGSSLMLVSD